MQELFEREKESDSDLKIVNPETKPVTIPFQKKSEKDCPPIKLVYKNRKEWRHFILQLLWKP